MSTDTKQITDADIRAWLVDRRAELGGRSVMVHVYTSDMLDGGAGFIIGERSTGYDYWGASYAEALDKWRKRDAITASGKRALAAALLAEASALEAKVTAT